MEEKEKPKKGKVGPPKCIRKGCLSRFEEMDRLLYKRGGRTPTVVWGRHSFVRKGRPQPRTDNLSPNHAFRNRKVAATLSPKGVD